MVNQTQNRFKNNRFPKKDDGGYKINEKIYAKEIRLVQDGEEPIICSTTEAFIKAKELGFDLVEVSPDAQPPICRITDFQKFLYEKKKKTKENKKSKSSTSLKEVKFSPNIGEHDFSFKAKQAGEFLKESHKVKATIFFKGRTIVYKEQGELVLFKLIQEVKDLGKVEQFPKMEGKFMSVIIVPKKKNG